MTTSCRYASGRTKDLSVLDRNRCLEGDPLAGGHAYGRFAEPDNAPPPASMPSKILVMSRFPRRSTQEGNRSGSTKPDEGGKSDLFSLERMSAGLSPDGTHSIHTLQPSLKQKRCHAEHKICMSQLRLHPFVSAQQTD